MLTVKHILLDFGKLLAYMLPVSFILTLVIRLIQYWAFEIPYVSLLDIWIRTYGVIAIVVFLYDLALLVGNLWFLHCLSKKWNVPFTLVERAWWTYKFIDYRKDISKWTSEYFNEQYMEASIFAKSRTVATRFAKNHPNLK